MTEVRSVKEGGGSGLFATKDYKAGDVIVAEEQPLIRLAPISCADEERLLANWAACDGEKKAGVLCQTDGTAAKKKAAAPAAAGKAKKGSDDEKRCPTFWGSIDVPEEVPDESKGKFRGLVQAAMCYAVLERAKLPEEERKEKEKLLLELYCPPKDPSEEEKSLVQMSKLALDLMKTKATKDGSELKEILCTGDDGEETLQKVMLIYACNAFEGGRVYEAISRINHSCDPKAVVKVGSSSSGCRRGTGDDDRQAVVAATDINAGEEITISYLGELLYADRAVRMLTLADTKYFACRCTRCATAKDVAASIPCSFCHPRDDGTKMLDEDVQYDDEQTVHYMCPMPPKETASDSDDDPSGVVYQCESCLKSFSVTLSDDDRGNGNDNGNDDSPSEIFKTANSVSEKVLAFFQDKYASKSVSGRQKQEAAGVAAGKDDEEGDMDEDLEREVLEESLRGACVAFLGARHWTTNLLLLNHLDVSLQEYHAELLDPSSDGGGFGGGGGEPDLERVAEFVDLLQRLYRFSDGLQLQLHPGHLLSDVTIGVARALVGLGDAKSQKYGSEWLDKVEDYVQLFESEGIQRVVGTLKVAHLRGKNDGKPKAKRQKMSRNR